VRAQPGNCPDGAVYNGVCFSAASVLPQVMRILRGPTSSIKTVLVSIGGAGCEGDFDYVSNTWPQFTTDFTALAEQFGFDGCVARGARLCKRGSIHGA
jgi:hypothetical protein